MVTINSKLLAALWASLVSQMVKNHLQSGRLGFDPWIEKNPLRREWLPTPGFLPGEFHGQRSLTVGYNPEGHKESDRTERLAHIHTHTHTHTHTGSV